MRDIKAFTFVEITVVVCIIAVVSSVAMPAIDNFMSSQRVSAEGEYFVSGVRMARYKAMQENALHRLVFDEDDNGNVSGYKIQIYAKYDDDNKEIWNDYDDGDTYKEYNETSSNVDLKNIEIGYNNTYWKSILEYDEILISSDITTTHTKTDNPCSPPGSNTIYFYPNGYLVKATKQDEEKDNLSDQKIYIIPEEILTFSYGNAKVIIHFNAMGILSSELLMEDEDEATGEADTE